jgi:peptide-methionine (S)-S-oxide reductase
MPLKIKHFIKMIHLISLIIFLSGCSVFTKNSQTNTKIYKDKIMSTNLDTAVFGMGCFWCTEAVFEELKGVQSVEAGYSGGTTENPTYKQVCTGETGHAEVARIIFDASVISYDQLLQVFWTTHDPTTLNKQGADVGTQYRSVIFYLNDKQKEAAEKSKKDIAPQVWDNPVVTEISPLSKFYKAEDYHQDYYDQNPNQGYCQYVITPKVDKFRKKFKDWLK